MLLCRRSQADLHGTSFGLPELEQDRLLASAPGARAWATPFCPFLAKTGDSRWDFFFVAIIFSVSAYRRFIWVSVQASNFLVLLRTSERLGNFSIGSTGPHITSLPPFCPTKEPQRSFQATGCTAISRILQRRRTYKVLTPSDAQASAAMVATPFTAVHTRAVVHDPPYQALMQQILGHG